MPGQVVHEIVERLQRARIGVAQHLVEPAFGLAGEQRQAHRLRVAHRIVVAADHRDDAGHVEAADRHLDARARSGRAMSSARGNWFDCTPDQHHHAGAGGLDQPRDAVRADAGVGLVEGVDFDLDVVAEHLLRRRSPWAMP